MSDKVIGILGGMGPEATLDLFGKIIHNTPASCDQEHLRVLIDNDPRIPDRTPAILGKGENPVPAMIAGLRVLASAGADFVIIPCISAHYFLEQLRGAAPVPILSAFDAVAEAVQEAGLSTVGLMATDGTVWGGRFAQVLTSHGITTLIPDLAPQRAVMDAIYAIKADPQGREREACRTRLQQVAATLIEKGAQGIIAGCTEIPLALRPEDLPVPLFDPLQLLALMAIREAKK